MLSAVVIGVAVAANLAAIVFLVDAILYHRDSNR